MKQAKRLWWLDFMKKPLVDKELIIWDDVKLTNWYERFWVKIIKIDWNNLVWTVNNKLLWDYWYNFWDEIEFEIENIIEIYNDKIW